VSKVRHWQCPINATLIIIKLQGARVFICYCFVQYWLKNKHMINILFCIEVWGIFFCFKVRMWCDFQSFEMYHLMGPISSHFLHTIYSRLTNSFHCTCWSNILVHSKHKNIDLKRLLKTIQLRKVRLTFVMPLCPKLNVTLPVIERANLQQTTHSYAN
jgi:hypothetical protein